MERSTSYSDYRSQLLQKALEEKKKLGLDGGHASNVRQSSALQALQCYGLDSNDVTLREPEGAICKGRTTERRKIIEVPKQNKATAESAEQQSLASNSFSSSSTKDGKPLRSILKKAATPLKSVGASNKQSPFSSNINTPFFLNNAENEDEFLYGKSINEQSLRVSALYARTKHLKTPVNNSSSNKKKDTTIDLFEQDSKTSSPSSGSKKLSSADSKPSTDLVTPKIVTSSNSKNKSTVVRSTEPNPKTSSNLSGYAALLSFSKSSVHSNVPPKTKNVASSRPSQKKCETSGNNKTNSPAHGNLMCGGFSGATSLKSPAINSVADKNRTEKSVVSVNKQVQNFLPRSVQKLQVKKPVDCSVDKKTENFETVTDKAVDGGSLHDSSGSDFLKCSEVKKCNVKPKPNKPGPPAKEDELMLLKYVQGSRNFYRGRSKSDQATKQISGGITNSDCKPDVKNSGTVDEKRKCDDVVPVSCTENIKPTVNNVSAMETRDSSKLMIKSDLGIKSELNAAKPDLKGSAISETSEKGIGFPNRKKKLIRKFTSIKKKKKNFFLQGKNSFRKELLSKRGPRNVFVHRKVHGHFSKSDSRVKHSWDSNSEKTAYAERGRGESKNYTLSPETEVCDRSFGPEKDIRNHNSRDCSNERYPMYQKSEERFSARSDRKYDLTPETDFIKQRRHENVSGPKRHSLYTRQGHDISGNSPRRHSRESSLSRHSDWSPSRNEFYDDVRGHSVNLSPSRYSFDASPKIWQNSDRSLSRQSFNESSGLHPFDRSCSPRPFSSSASYSRDRSPNVPPFGMSDSHPYDDVSPVSRSFNNQSPDLDPYDEESHGAHSYMWSPDTDFHSREQDSYLYDRSPDRNSYSRSPDRLSRGGSPRPGSCARSSSSHSYGRNRDSCSRRQRSGHHSYDGSPGPESCDQSSGMRLQEMSPGRETFRKERRRQSSNSPRRSVEMSPIRLSGERGPGRVSNNASQKFSQGRSSRKFSSNESYGMHSAELSLRLSSEREARNKSDVSPCRFQESRIDSYHSSPDRIYCRDSSKESCENLKPPRRRSPETVMFDSREQSSERTSESNHGDMSQNLSSGALTKCQQLNLGHSFGEEGNRSMEKQDSSSLYGISQHQKQQNILDQNFVIPDVNKIVNAIDALVSNYYKTVTNEKTNGITPGYSSQSFDSTLNAQNPVQLNTASATYAYDQSCYSYTNNNSQPTYNSEVPKVFYPPYNVPSVNSYLPNCTPVSSGFHSTTAAASPYSSTDVAANVSVQAPFSDTPQQYGGGFVSSAFCDGNVASPVQKQCSTIDELSELYPADESNFGASGDSRERVTALTVVPLHSNVLPDEFAKKNSSKFQSNTRSVVTMKFITPEKIEKLLRHKSEIRKQIGCLNDEYEKLLKMEGDTLRRKRRGKSGHKDLLLLQYSELKEDVKNQLNNLVGDMKNIEQELKNGFLGCASENETGKFSTADGKGKEPKKSGECAEDTADALDYYEFNDSGSHWCKYCNKLCATVINMLEHVKSDEHLMLISQVEKPWCSIPSSEKPVINEQKGEKITKPIKGIQFIMPVEGFYCSLCKEYFEKVTHMEEHLKSLKHFEIYQNYTSENPTYERQWLMERLAGLSHMEIEDNKTASMEDTSFEKKQKEKLNGKKVEEKLGKEEDEIFRREGKEQSRQKKEENLLQTGERTMDKKKHNAREEKYVENIKEHREETKYSEKDEEKLMIYRKQNAFKRKKDEDNEKSKKIRILNSVHEAEQRSGKPENTSDADLPAEGQSVPGAKWTVCSQQKKLHVSKSKESKSKPKQTVVYIGRAPNFRSHGKGNSSFRENLLKLALQKKEAAMNPDSATVSTGTSINSNASSPVVSETVKPQSGLTDTAGNDVTDTCSPLAGECAVNQQVTHSQSSSEIEINSKGLQSNCNVSASSTPAGSNTRSASDNDIFHRSLTCASYQQKISTSDAIRSDFVPDFQSFRSNACNSQKNYGMTAANVTYVGSQVCSGTSSNSDTDLGHFRDQMLPANISPSTPWHVSYATGQTNESILSSVKHRSTSGHSVSRSNLPVKPGSRKSLQEHSKKSDTVHGPLTEEEDDFRLLGINSEDRLPLVLPKPPPASLIWSCPKDDASGERSSEKIASMTSDSNASKNQLINSGTDNVIPAWNNSASHPGDGHIIPATSTAQIVENSGNLFPSQQSFMYGAKITQEQSVSYSANVQTKFSAPFGSVDCTNTSSMHHTHTYPYNSNTGNLTPFQGNFGVPNEHMPRFRGAQARPPMQFQNMAPQTRYPCQQALPPDCYRQKSINFYPGRYPPSQFPPPNVNPHQNYGPVFQRNFGPHTQMPRRMFRNKQWHIQRKMKSGQDADKREKPASPKKELPSKIKTEEQVLNNSENEKLVSHKTANVVGCAVNSISEAIVLKREPSFATVSSEQCTASNEEGMKILDKGENAQKLHPVQSGGDISNCVKFTKESANSEQNDVPPEDVPASDSGVSNNQASVQGIKQKVLSPVVENNDSEQVSAYEATVVETQDTATTFITPVNKLCENTVGGTDVKIDQGTSQQNNLRELKISEGATCLESEKHHTSASDKSQ